LREPLEFVRRQPIETGAALFPGRIRGQLLGQREAAGKIGMGADEGELFVFRHGACDDGHGLVQAARRIAFRSETLRMRAGRDLWRVLVDVAENVHEQRVAHAARHIAAPGRMRPDPVSCDVETSRDPDAIVLADIVEKTRQRGSAAGTADETAMQADRHHLRPIVALGVERVETVLEIGEELFAAIETLRRGEAHVVGVERVGHEQLLAFSVIVPIGQFVGIDVGRIEKAAFFYCQRNGIFRRAALVEA